MGQRKYHVHHVRYSLDLVATESHGECRVIATFTDATQRWECSISHTATGDCTRKEILIAIRLLQNVVRKYRPFTETMQTAFDVLRAKL